MHGYFVLVFIPKFLISVTFAQITRSAPALFGLNRKSSETTPEWLLPVVCCEKCEYNLLNIILYYYFSLEVVLQDMGRNNPAEKQIDAEIQATFKHGTALKLTKEKM